MDITNFLLNIKGDLKGDLSKSKRLISYLDPLLVL